MSSKSEQPKPATTGYVTKALARLLEISWRDETDNPRDHRGDRDRELVWAARREFEAEKARADAAEERCSEYGPELACAESRIAELEAFVRAVAADNEHSPGSVEAKKVLRDD